MPKVAVLIVSYRTPELTRSAVLSVARADREADIVVVDNASGDDSVRLVRDLQDERTLVLVNEKNVGYGAAANRAVRESSGDILVFLNSDAELSRSAMRELVAEVERYDGQCIAAARLVGLDGVLQRSAGLLPGPVDLAVRALGLSRLAATVAGWPILGRLVRGNRLAREYESAVVATMPVDTSMVSGACCAMGRNAFEKLGGFDERFFLYFEDADLCRRATKAGIALRYLPAAGVPHIGGASSIDDYHLGPNHARSMRQYLGKWYGAGGSAFAMLILWLRAMGMTMTLQGGARRAWRAWWAALRDEDPRQ